jgi:hypothetical protein
MNNNLKTLHTIFSKPTYVVLALMLAVLIWAGIVWLSAYQVITYALSSELFDWGAKLKIIWTSLGSFNTNFTLSSQISVVLVSILSGVNFSMLVYHFRSNFLLQKNSGMGMLGVVIGTFGVGCSACGSVILSSFFGVGTATLFVSWLPLQGIEFSIVGILLILVSIFLLTKKIRSPNSCSIK